MPVCFKIFDSDRDGVLSRAEVHHLIASLKQLSVDQYSDDGPEGAIVLEAADLLPNDTESVSLEPFLIWAVQKDSLKHLLDMLHQVSFTYFLNLHFKYYIIFENLFQLCHIVLGLRPASRIEEGNLIQHWLRRENRRGYRIGDFWYLIASNWWKQWTDYVANQEEPQQQQHQAGRASAHHSSVSLKHSISDSGSEQGGTTAVRPRAIDNSCLVAPATVKASISASFLFD